MIATVTLNPAVDHTIRIQGELDTDGVTRSSMSQYDAGGKGINVSKYLCGLEAETVATGLVGGFLGDYVRDELRMTKIPSDFVEMAGCTRLNTTILTDEEEYKVNQPGHRVKEHTVQEVIATLDSHDPDTVVVAGSLPPGLGPAAIDRLAHAGDWDAVADVQGTTLRELRTNYALCAPNRRELAAATGQPVGTLEKCFDAAATLRDEGFDRVVASLGEDGAVMATGETAFHAPAPDIDVVDTVGAGDALLAGVLDALTAGKSSRTALRWGVAVASRAITVPGTTTPPLSDLQTDLEAIPVRAR